MTESRHGGYDGTIFRNGLTSMTESKQTRNCRSTETEERKNEKEGEIMYMSYCRFEGTKQELRHCLNDVTDHINKEAEYPVSDGEIRHFRAMVYDFVEFLQDTEILDENGEVDKAVLDTVCEKMKEGGYDE